MKKTVIVILGALVGLVILSIIAGYLNPDDKVFFAYRMVWALGMILCGLIGAIGGYEALDQRTSGDWGDALMQGNMAVAVATSGLFVLIGLLLLGTVSVVM